mmetsp:Transcript_6591/g.16798  ORF Transcript_6591/g.16798 Transcript_6591/m.16798 type:complete len:220 (+) Transcript_6591:109-768(+)
MQVIGHAGCFVQQAHGWQVAASLCIVKRREAGSIANAYRCTMREERLNGRRVTKVRGLNQRSRPARRVHRVDTSAILQEHADGGIIVALNGVHERSPVAGVLHIGVGSAVDEAAQNLFVSVERCKVNGRPPVQKVLLIEACTVLQEGGHNLRMGVLFAILQLEVWWAQPMADLVLLVANTSQHQRSVSRFVAARFQVGLALDEQFCHLNVTQARCVGKR